MAELVDAHDSGSCVLTGVEVRVLSSAPPGGGAKWLNVFPRPAFLLGGSKSFGSNILRFTAPSHNYPPFKSPKRQKGSEIPAVRKPFIRWYDKGVENTSLSTILLFSSLSEALNSQGFARNPKAGRNVSSKLCTGRPHFLIFSANPTFSLNPCACFR